MLSPVSMPARTIFVLTLLFCLLPTQSLMYGEPVALVTVEAGDYDRIDIPVSLDLSGVPLGFPSDER